MTNFTKGFNGVSADMIKAAADIAKQSARVATEQRQEDANKMAARYESVRPNNNVESGSRPVERMYASMKPTHLNPVGETIASRVAALSEGTKTMKPVTKHETLPHDSYLLEPKVKMAKPLKKIPADEAVLTDEDIAFLEAVNADAGTTPTKPAHKELAKLAHPKNKITHKDVLVGRGVVAKEETEAVEEGWDEMLADVKAKKGPQPSGGAGIKKGKSYGNQKPGEEKNEKKEKEEANEGKMVDKIKSFAKKALEKAGGGSDETQLKRLQKDMGVEQTGKKPAMKEERDTPGQEHVCAVHVKHAKLGEGRTLFSQHAEPDADGHIAWYDVMFEDEILRVNTKELEIIEAMSHGNHKKK